MMFVLTLPAQSCSTSDLETELTKQGRQSVLSQFQVCIDLIIFQVEGCFCSLAEDGGKMDITHLSPLLYLLPSCYVYEDISIHLTIISWASTLDQSDPVLRSNDPGKIRTHSLYLGSSSLLWKTDLGTNTLQCALYANN